MQHKVFTATPKFATVKTWGLIYKVCVRSDLILECVYA